MNWLTTCAAFGVLRFDEPMARHTTLAVGGPARWFFRPHSAEALAQLLPLLPADLPVFPLGRGSNLLVRDGGIQALVLDLAGLDAIEQQENIVRAEGGARMGKLATFTAQAGLAGLEFMVTVPGNVGGGVVMNAGAYGQQVSDTLQSVELLNRQGEHLFLTACELAMGYRHSQLPAGAMVVAASFLLADGDASALKQRIATMRESRSASQPLALPNCGSVFKNPPGNFAGALIEQAGLKGFVCGGARISPQHANFIVNEGAATASDVLALIAKAQSEVARLFNIRLEPEVRVVGSDA